MSAREESHRAQGFSYRLDILDLVVFLTTFAPEEMRVKSEAAFGPILVAQYVRMSTEQQQYSLDNQSLAIGQYAEQHNMMIVRTYSDAGRTGLTLTQRPGRA